MKTTTSESTGHSCLDEFYFHLKIEQLSAHIGKLRIHNYKSLLATHTTIVNVDGNRVVVRTK